MFDRLTLLTILHVTALGLFFALGWSALARLWAWLGDRGQLAASVVVLVVILVAVALTYAGASA